jgi:NADPH-dependent ferric siderophore reductase
MAPPLRVRREPPRFRRVAVRQTTPVTPRLVRVTLAGGELDGFAIEQPAASVRLLLPSPGAAALDVPVWNGNEFLLPDGSRPAIRTVTPRRVVDDGAGAPALDIELVVHGSGLASRWAQTVAPGAPAAISGPGRGYPIAGDAPAFLLAGDETAIPAIAQLLEALPTTTDVSVHVEVAAADARLDFPPHPRAAVTWHDLPSGATPGDALAEAVRAAEIVPGARIWVAGEAAAVQRVRRHLFDERGVPRALTVVRGYWKHGRSGGAADDD